MSPRRPPSAFFGADTPRAGREVNPMTTRAAINRFRGMPGSQGRGVEWAHQSPRIFIDSGEEVAGSLGEFSVRMAGRAGQFPVKTAAIAL